MDFVIALCIGDPHFQTDNVKDCEVLMNKLEELCIATPPDFIVVLGDLLHEHERLHTQVLNRAYSLIRRLREFAPVFVLVGNHDAITNQIYLTEDHWMNGMKEWERVTVIDTTIVESVKGRAFTFVPYVPPGRFREALESVGEAWKDCYTIFAHQEFKGCKMGAIISDKGDGWDCSLPFVISGHIHNSQDLDIGVHYPGSSLQVAFGETDAVTVTVAEWKGVEKRPILSKVDLQLPKKKIVYTDTDHLEKLDTVDPVNTKLSISGSLEEFKAFKKTEKYKSLLRGGAKVIFKPTKTEEKSSDSVTRQHIETVLETSTDFGEVLRKVVLSQKDPYLAQVYDFILSGRESSVEDYLFLP